MVVVPSAVSAMASRMITGLLKMYPLPLGGQKITEPVASNSPTLAADAGSKTRVGSPSMYTWPDTGLTAIPPSNLNPMVSPTATLRSSH